MSGEQRGSSSCCNGDTFCCFHLKERCETVFVRVSYRDQPRTINQMSPVAS